ncbi:MAG TPA: hypothetical protein VFC78_24075 [Tepidisphaeraceae bacterium]|nr:hypothetical protein [Tepidisphaeraceae bacterium]
MSAVVAPDGFGLVRYTLNGHLDAFGYHDGAIDPNGISGKINAIVAQPTHPYILLPAYRRIACR